MMPEFAKSLFGFGSSRSSTANTPTPSSTNSTPPPRTSQDKSSMSSPSGSNLPTATNSRTTSLSGTSGGFNFTNAKPTTALSTEVQATSSSSTPAPVRGKLRVRVTEARDLRIYSSSSVPYVICTFDSSEFISHGPSGSSLTPGGIAIPSRSSRQSSSVALSKLSSLSSNPSHPVWKDEAQFDVTSDHGDLDISIYDAGNDEAFLGHVRVTPTLNERTPFDRWLKLGARVPGERVSGEIRVCITFERASQQHIGPEDFEILRLVGKGTFGQVYQVRKKDSQRIYAMKVLSKRAIVQKKEIAHTIGERDILVRTTAAESAFIVGLKFSFQTPADLYLVTDYMSGGELFWHLQKEGRFKEDRAKFYIAELILALESLHDHDIVYRDLKPENVLLDANGHVALCDFGLSKANPTDGKTNTFCGTTEYLAPEVLLDDKGYTKMVDFWSLGVLVFEMCCGWSPFYAEDNQQMYKNIAFGKVRFPKDALSPEGRNFVKGLLNRNPKHRLGALEDTRELRRHEFFRDIDWDLLRAKKIPPPFKPHVTSETDTSNFDPEFTQASTSAMNRGLTPSAMTPLSPGIQANFQGFTYVGEPTLEEHYRSHRPRSHVAADGDIDLYDDNDIASSTSYYNMKGSDLMRQLQKYSEQQQQQQQQQQQHQPHHPQPLHHHQHDIQDDRMDEDGSDDDRMMDDDDEDGFVNGQRFEL
uniref:Serine/threonine-protein kinase SCH9 n=1 Tax=Blastobotrys adeninivorans TaxID=409370 RepID=A0A060T3U1_BLAAD